MTNFQAYSRVDRWKMPPMAATPQDRPGLPDPQCSGGHRSSVQRGHFRAHLLQNRRRQRGVALRLRDFLPGPVHPPSKLNVVMLGEAGIRTGRLTAADTLQTGMTRNGEITKPKPNIKTPSKPAPRARRKPIATAISLIASS